MRTLAVSMLAACLLFASCTSGGGSTLIDLGPLPQVDGAGKVVVPPELVDELALLETSSYPETEILLASMELRRAAIYYILDGSNNDGLVLYSMPGSAGQFDADASRITAMLGATSDGDPIFDDSRGIASYYVTLPYSITYPHMVQLCEYILRTEGDSMMLVQPQISYFPSGG